MYHTIFIDSSVGGPDLKSLLQMLRATVWPRFIFLCFVYGQWIRFPDQNTHMVQSDVAGGQCNVLESPWLPMAAVTKGCGHDLYGTLYCGVARCAGAGPQLDQKSAAEVN